MEFERRTSAGGNKGSEQLETTLTDRKNILERINGLSGTTTATLKGLQKRLNSLEKEVSQVHNETQQLHNAHHNMGLAMHSVRECAAKMRSVQPLLDMITNGQIHADVDEFMEQLGQLNESITFAQKHKGLRDVPDVLVALKDARRKALSGLEFEYSRVLEAQKPSEEDEEWESGSEVQALKRLRDALGERGQNETSSLFVKIRSRVVATHLRSLEEALLISIRSARDIRGHKYTQGRHPFLPLPLELLSILKGEVRLAAVALREEEASASLGKLFEGPITTLSRITTESLELEGGRGGSILVLLDALSHLQEAVHGSQSSGEEGLLGLLAECEVEGESSAKALVSLLERLKVAAGDALNSLPQTLKSHPGRPGHSVEAGEPATTAAAYATQLVAMKEMYDGMSLVGKTGGSNSGLRRREKLGDYIARLFEAATAHVHEAVKPFKDAKLGALYGVSNMHVLVDALNGDAEVALLAEVPQECVDTVVKVEREMRDMLLQEIWVSPLQPLSCVHIPASSSDAGSVLRRSERHQVKDALSHFNKEIDHILHALPSWRVHDDALRESLHDEHVEWVLPLYRAFFDRYVPLKFSTHPDKYVRFTPEGIEGIIRQQIFVKDRM